jgi:asparagine synthase (glutamine-hydrolysing)
MCGIAGKFNRCSGQSVGEDELRKMLAMIRHRGPDEFGILLDGDLALGSARLSIIDVAAGQ